MKTKHPVRLMIALLIGCVLSAFAGSQTETNRPPPVSKTYVLSPNDVVHMKVFQEEVLESKVRIEKDGTATFPLIGTIKIGGKTVEKAAALIRDLLDADYVVNPQVSVTVFEYAKRRFTVLGQVQKPGAYEIPNEETMTLLQAVGVAGGFTRLANASKVIVSRTVDGKKVNYHLDAKSLTSDPTTKPFEVLPDDTITVAERIF